MIVVPSASLALESGMDLCWGQFPLLGLWGGFGTSSHCSVLAPVLGVLPWFGGQEQDALAKIVVLGAGKYKAVNQLYDSQCNDIQMHKILITQSKSCADFVSKLVLSCLSSTKGIHGMVVDNTIAEEQTYPLYQ